MRAAAVFLLFCSFAPAQKKPVTLETAAQTPPVFAGQIGTPVWSPDGRSFVYALQKKLWHYDLSNNGRRELGSLETLEKAAAKAPDGGQFAWENRRVREQALQWTPDGKSLIVSAGGDLFLWPIESGKWVQLTATTQAERDPKLSPDGRMISFQRDNELHVMDLASRSIRQLTDDSTATIWNARLDWVYPEELALGTAHWWSPDSSRIAFLQFDVSREWIYPHANLLPRDAEAEPQRYPKAGTPNPEVRLGVVAAAGGKVVWADLGDPRHHLLARVDWLPDSRRLAAQRLNRVQNELTLLFTDVSTGAAKTILTERDPYWVNISDDLHFLEKRDGFLWSSEESGYRHLYLYGLDGKRQKQLTKGNWEVKRVEMVDEERNQVYFTSRRRSPLNTDLAAVGLNGGAPRTITQAAGTHTASLAPDGSHFIDTYCSLGNPVRKTLNSITGEQVTTLQPPHPRTEEYEYIRPEIVPVKAADGATMYASLIKPRDFEPTAKYPAIVMVYGGPHAQAVTDCYGGLSYEQALAQRGYVVWQLDNRGTAGRGHAWETKLYRRLGKQELEDQQQGIRHLISTGFVDPQRIGLFGWSYGGFMTLYTMFNAPGLIRAGIAGAPVTDWRNYDTIYTERYLGLPEENAEGYRLSSPVHQAANLAAPLMLVHNYGDDNVLFQQSFQMMVELQKAGKQYESVIYPQRTHGVTGALRKHMLEAMTAFFERHLRPAEAVENRHAGYNPAPQDGRVAAAIH